MFHFLLSCQSAPPVDRYRASSTSRSAAEEGCTYRKESQREREGERRRCEEKNTDCREILMFRPPRGLFAHSMMMLATRVGKSSLPRSLRLPNTGGKLCHHSSVAVSLYTHRLLGSRTGMVQQSCNKTKKHFKYLIRTCACLYRAGLQYLDQLVSSSTLGPNPFRALVRFAKEAKEASTCALDQLLRRNVTLGMQVRRLCGSIYMWPALFA